MVKVPTQIFVVNSFSFVILSSYWLYVTYETINTFYLMAKDPRNFIELVEETD